MRISPKQFLQGLLYLTPITLLALASCGGGGGGGSNTTLASYYTLSVNVVGISGVTTAASGVELRNGGDNLTFTAPGTQPFQHQVLSGSTYNISVLSQPATTPAQVCTVTGPVGTMPATNTTVGVNCVKGYTIGGTTPTYGVTGLAAGASVVLQNNGSDNLLVTASGTFTFSTPVTSDYDVKVLIQPAGQTCLVTNGKNTASINVTNVLVACTNNTGPVTPDLHVYVANSGDSTAWTYAANASNGALSTPSPYSSSTGTSPSAIAVYGGKYAFVTNSSSNTVSAYSVASGVLSATPIANTATGNTPVAIAVHPSGKFVYVVNQLSNSISAYSITSTGALASIDANGATTANEPTIATALTPVAIAIDPTGAYAYVTNLGAYTTGVCSHASVPSYSGCISVYSINTTNGALTAIDASGTSHNIDTGQTPSSVAVDPSGKYVYVTNNHDNNVSIYSIDSSTGQLTNLSSSTLTGSGPKSIAINPVNGYVYVANTNSDDVSAFSFSSGTLTHLDCGSNSSFCTNSTTTGYTNNFFMGTTGSHPVSISIDSTGQYAYVANYGTSKISGFKISTNSPYMTQVGIYSAGSKPVSITTGP